MTPQKIKESMAKLDAMLVDKGVVTPECTVMLTSTSTKIHMSSRYGTHPYDGRDYKIITADSISECVEVAASYIAAMPDPETTKVRAFQKNLANVIDEGNSLNMPNEVMEPLHAGSQALSDNLLTDQREAS